MCVTSPRRRRPPCLDERGGPTDNQRSIQSSGPLCVALESREVARPGVLAAQQRKREALPVLEVRVDAFELMFELRFSRRYPDKPRFRQTTHRLPHRRHPLSPDPRRVASAPNKSPLPVSCQGSPHSDGDPTSRAKHSECFSSSFLAFLEVAHVRENHVKVPIGKRQRTHVVGNASDVPTPCFAEDPRSHLQHSRRNIEQHEATVRLEARSNEPRKCTRPGPKLEDAIAGPKGRDVCQSRGDNRKSRCDQTLVPLGDSVVFARRGLGREVPGQPTAILGFHFVSNGPRYCRRLCPDMLGARSGSAIIATRSGRGLEVLVLDLLKLNRAASGAGSPRRLPPRCGMGWRGPASVGYSARRRGRGQSGTDPGGGGRARRPAVCRQPGRGPAVA